MPNLSLSFLDEIQMEVSRLETLGTCLDMAGATDYLKEVNELRGFMLNIAHFQQLQIDRIQGKLDQCFPKPQPTLSKGASHDNA
ncbi:hypothetical protein BKK52_05375 [Rodentibacter trehalosifermentans]|uniref:Uncharacterized protein n=1 Tax=Rodentibacter trehalosifermentans TaxID=1908263 RepID=A0A1V3J1K3_9PAST|nr:hypothetical protein [Rodentibacter trehalosifermentans]OOF48530.1 hypothetical protein BKK52_05375 [Rodentibacter trehalosifermentans]